MLKHPYDRCLICEALILQPARLISLLQDGRISNQRMRPRIRKGYPNSILTVPKLDDIVERTQSHTRMSSKEF